jgi:MarR family transcriptional regulator, organic hydroperoxide resistance regulator
MTKPSQRRMQPTGEALRFMQRLWDLAHALDVRSKHMAKELGVTSPQRLVIRVVGQSPGMTARDIAATLNIHPSTLTGVLARLEKQGMLVRTIDPVDRRRAHFELTAAGLRVDRERKGTVEAAVRRALARADDPMIAHTEQLLALIVAELGRDD